MAALTAAGRLQPADSLALRRLLRDAFSSAPRMSDLLLAINRQFNDYYGLGDEYPEAVQKMVARANEELWWRELLAQVRRVRPTDPLLAAFAEEFDLAPVPVETTGQGSTRIGKDNLQAKIKAANPSLDIEVFRAKLGAIEVRVCRIEYPSGTPRGTGFLVGPDVVMTNFHVVEPIVKAHWKPHDVILRFDYKVQPNGVAVGAGTSHRLEANWLVDHSPYSACDLISEGPECEPEAHELDYALLRVQGAPGREPLFASDPNPVERGWIDVPSNAELAELAEPNASRALFIVQHPDGLPMQVALDTEAITGVTKPGGTRLRYTTNTAHGSSGSPCFDAQWRWIALHHSGDPKYPGPAGPARFNQGIPLAAIVKLLEQRGLRAELGRS